MIAVVRVTGLAVSSASMAHDSPAQATGASSGQYTSPSGRCWRLPDGEVYWPEEAPVAWAGESWAVEAELTPKPVTRTTAIMREILLRTGDYGCPAADAVVPGQPPRHQRALYLCSPAALGTVLRARAELGPLAARVEVRDLPAGALL